MQNAFTSQLLADMILNDLVDNNPIVFEPNGLRMIAVGNSQFNIKTYMEIFEIVKVLSLKLNKLTESGKSGKVGTADSFITSPLTDFNLKMIYDVLGLFFKKFGCNIKIRENHAAINNEPRLKIKVVWK